MTPEANATDLCVNRERWIPRIRGDNLAQAVSLCLDSDLANVFKRIPPLFLCRAVGRGFLEAVRPTFPLNRLFAGGWRTSSLNRS